MCRHGLAHDFDALAGALVLGKGPPAEIVFEAKLSAKAIPELAPGRRWEGKSAGPRVVRHFVAAGNRTRLRREGAGGKGHFAPR